MLTGKRCLVVVNKTEYCLYKHVLAYFRHLKWINAGALIPDFKMNQMDQLSLSVIFLFWDLSPAGDSPAVLRVYVTLMRKHVVMVGHDWLGSGHDRFQMERRTSVSASPTRDLPFNPLTFPPPSWHIGHSNLCSFTSFAETECSKGGLYQNIDNWGEPWQRLNPQPDGRFVSTRNYLVSWYLIV